MMKRKTSVLMIGATLLSISLYSLSASAGEDSGFDREIEYRQSLMTLLSWNMKSMGAMVKGKIPFDQTSFSRHAEDLEAIASLDLLSGFPEDSDQGETDARADIWLDFEDFKNKLKGLQESSGTLSQAASGGDKEQMKTAFGKVGKACKACHKAYKD